MLDDGETERALAMVDDRNLTVHTYNEELAQAIYARLGCPSRKCHPPAGIAVFPSTRRR